MYCLPRLRTPILFRQALSTELATDNVTINYTNANPHSLVSVQHYNFAPRVGLAYQIDAKTVVRAAYGLFYGGLESPGGSELQENFPFAYSLIIDNQYKTALWRLLSIHTGRVQQHQQPMPIQRHTGSIGRKSPILVMPTLGVESFPGYSTPVGLNPFPYATNWEIEGTGYLNAGLANLALRPLSFCLSPT